MQLRHGWIAHRDGHRRAVQPGDFSGSAGAALYPVGRIARQPSGSRALRVGSADVWLVVIGVLFAASVSRGHLDHHDPPRIAFGPPVSRVYRNSGVVVRQRSILWCRLIQWWSSYWDPARSTIAGFMTFDETLRSMTLFTQEVYPRLKEMTASYDSTVMKELRSARPDVENVDVSMLASEFVR